jgi:hypothetical protein
LLASYGLQAIDFAELGPGPVFLESVTFWPRGNAS